MADINFTGWTIDDDTELILDFNSGAGSFIAPQNSGITIQTNNVDTVSIFDPNAIYAGGIKSNTKGVRLTGGIFDNFDVNDTEWTLEGFFRLNPGNTRGSAIFAFVTSALNMSAGASLTIWRGAEPLPSVGYIPNGALFLRSRDIPNSLWTAQTFNDGNVHHFSVVCSNRTYYLRVDGVYLGSASEAVNDTTLAAALDIGNPNNGFNENEDIILDEIRFSTTLRYPADTSNTDRLIINAPSVSIDIPFPNNTMQKDSVAVAYANTVNIPDNTSIFMNVVLPGANSGSFPTVPFALVSQTVTVQNNQATFILQALDNGILGTQTYEVIAKAGGAGGNIVARSDAFFVQDHQPNFIFPFKDTINEGEQIIVDFYTTVYPSSTVLYYTFNGVDSSDFPYNLTPGFNENINAFAIGTNNFGGANPLVPTRLGRFAIRPALDFTAEGDETFTLEVRTGSTSGPIIATSPTITVVDTSNVSPFTYAVTPAASNVDEGNSLVFNVTTTGVTDGTVLYWTLDNATDFLTSNGNVVVNSNAASFTVTPTADVTTEGSETFVATLRTSSLTGTVVAQSSTVTINDTSTGIPTYTIRFDDGITDLTRPEGSVINLTVTTTDVDDGTVVYWSFESSTGPGLADGNDITGSLGSITINNGIGRFSFTLAEDTLTEGTETLKVFLYSDVLLTDLLASTPNQIIVTDTSISPASYSITESANTVSEGEVLTFNVLTANVSNGTVLYWTVSNANDFVEANGSITIIGNANSFTVTPREDLTTEGSETFSTSLRTGNVTGTVVATSNTITIIDTSLSPPTYAITPAITNVNEGNAVLFNVTTTNVPDGTTLYWALDNLGNVEITVSDFITISNSFVIANGTGVFSVNVSSDFKSEGTEFFRTLLRVGSNVGNIVAQSVPIRINDTSLTSDGNVLVDLRFWDDSTIDFTTNVKIAFDQSGSNNDFRFNNYYAYTSIGATRFSSNARFKSELTADHAYYIHRYL